MLYINADSLTTIDGSKFPYLAYNESVVFNQRNPEIDLNYGDSLEITLINKHTITHQFKIKGHASAVLQVMPGDTVTAIYAFDQPGLFIFHDPLDFPANTYMGLAGMIIVREHNHKRFYWNIKEHQSAYNFDVSSGIPVNWGQYDPEYFTVNALSNPQIDMDPTSRVSGSVGDTIILYMANTGLGIHAIHFHGYHAEILSASAGSKHVGRMKDTFPLHSMGTLILRLVPDKPGIYPLHNHNLVAVSANRVYPNGMFTTISISP